jgi:CheY-like chemotaxis protein
MTYVAAIRGRLLAVDDDPDSADLVAEVASMCGYEAQSACTPEALSALVTSWKPEVLTLDLGMPKADGIDLLSTLGFTGLLIIISGHDDPLREAAGRRARTRGLKVIEGLRKPIDISVLRQILNRLRQDA